MCNSQDLQAAFISNTLQSRFTFNSHLTELLGGGSFIFVINLHLQLILQLKIAFIKIDEITYSHEGKKVLESILSSKNMSIHIIAFRNIFGAADEVWLHKAEACSGSGQMNTFFLVLFSACPCRREKWTRGIVTFLSFLGFST